MFCLSCDQESPNLGPECLHCQGFIGYVAEGQGYLPQLESMATAYQAGELEMAEVDARLDRLAGCLETLIQNLEQTGQGLVSLELDESQRGTLAGFLTPLKEAWDKQLELVRQLDVVQEGAWDEFLSSYKAAQIECFRASEGVNYLTMAIAGMASQQGVDVAEVEAAIVQAAQGEDQPAEEPA